MDEGLSNRMHYCLYFFLLLIVLSFITLYSFTNLIIRADKFTMFLMSLLFVLLLLPMVTYIKIFDVVEIRKELNSLKKEFNERIAVMEAKRRK